MSLPYLFTSESVSDGHPDKLADRNSDTVLDRRLTLDPDAGVACETLLADDLVVVAGEFRLGPVGAFETVRSELDGIVRQLLHETGYSAGFPGIDIVVGGLQLRRPLDLYTVQPIALNAYRVHLHYVSCATSDDAGPPKETRHETQRPACAFATVCRGSKHLVGV